MMRPSIYSIQQAVAEHYGVTVDDIKSPRRTGDLVRARQMAIYLARELTGRSFPVIARMTGGRHHSTAMHAHSVVRERLSTAETLAVIKAEFGA